MKGVAGKTLRLLHALGLFEGLRALTPHRLTVLSYHRVEDPLRDGFDTFKPVVSASPAAFEAQIGYLCEHFNIVSIGTVIAWLEGGADLPSHAALVTFDDGYQDNYTHAFPILKARCIPAVIFLATDHVDERKPYVWDLIAYCLYHTKRDFVDHPLLGSMSWPDGLSREKIISRWVSSVRASSGDTRRRLIDMTPELLDVSVPEYAFDNLCLRWSQVREMAEHGIEMGSHTASHPNMALIPSAQTEAELLRSKRRIEAEIGEPVVSFAYPYGHAAELNRQVVATVREAGFKIAFTLVAGSSPYAEIRRNPFTIRRIFVNHADSMASFAAKTAGLRRL